MFTYKAASFLVHIELLFINSPFPHQPLILKRRKKNKDKKKMEIKWQKPGHHSTKGTPPLTFLHWNTIYFLQGIIPIIQWAKVCFLKNSVWKPFQVLLYFYKHRQCKLRAINQQLSCSMCCHIHNKQVWGHKN